MTDTPHETSVGATAGLPGENAAPETRELSDDELASTVAMGDVSEVEADEPE